MSALQEVHQIDCEWKVRYREAGVHIHCTLFVRQRGQSTWQNCGNFVIGVEQALALAKAMPKAVFEEAKE